MTREEFDEENNIRYIESCDICVNCGCDRDKNRFWYICSLMEFKDNEVSKNMICDRFVLETEW